MSLLPGQNPLFPFHVLEGFTQTCTAGLYPHLCLSLSNITLFFVTTFKFLFLIVGSKLSWESHFRYLRMKRKRSLDVLKILSGRSWGGYWTVMLWLYCTLIHSRIGYDSFVYGSAMKSKLSVIDSVLNIAYILPLASFIQAIWRVCICNWESPYCLSVGIFSFANVLWSWQHNPSTWLMQLCFVQLSATGKSFSRQLLDLWVYTFKKPPIATSHTVALYYPP